MEKSATIGKLAESLAKAQGAMEPAKKDSDNPFFKSKYADLAAVKEAIRIPFFDNGLSISQTLGSSDDGGVIVETLLMHSSGEWLSGSIKIKPAKLDAQGYGAVISYMRRYSLSAIAGGYAEDDDAETDRQHAEKNAKPQTPHETKLSESQQKYFPRVKVALDALYGGDTDKKKAKIKELTSFIGKEGNPVQGVEDYRRLDGKRLGILCHNLEKFAPKTINCPAAGKYIPADACEGCDQRGGCPEHLESRF